MKHYTQHQKNVITETKEKFEKAKQPEYRLKKWRGNTLVPVVIGLAVSGVATVAFLNQGSSLAQDNKAILAKNEIASIVSQFDVIQSSVTPRGVSLGMLTKLSSSKRNAYGLAFSFTPCGDTCSFNQTPMVTYETPGSESCELLRVAFNPTRDPSIQTSLCVSDSDLEKLQIVFTSDATQS